MVYQYKKLANQLPILYVPSTSPVSYCGFVVKAGARDEEEEEQGLAHFVEHMMFKGTEKRKSHHILNRMENVGGELNAYTTKEETFVYTVFPNYALSRAVELLGDILFHSTFPPAAIATEREVIIDEINSYKDSPSELIFDDFENMVFSGHPIGHNILGAPKTLRAFDDKIGRQFMKHYYVPSNMVFFYSGKTPLKRVKALAEKYFGCAADTNFRNQRTAPMLSEPQEMILPRSIYQTHVIIGSHCYNLYDKKHRILFLLNNILGGPGMNSRLNTKLREKSGMVYSIESNCTNYSDTGVFSIYFGSDPKNRERCIAQIMKELKVLREKKLSTLQLSMAKKQLIGQIIISLENRESNLLSMAKSFLYFDKIETPENSFSTIEKITAEALLEVANEIFDPSQLYQLIYEPPK